MDDAEKKPEIDVEIEWDVIVKKSCRWMQTEVLSERTGSYEIF